MGVKKSGGKKSKIIKKVEKKEGVKKSGGKKIKNHLFSDFVKKQISKKNGSTPKIFSAFVKKHQISTKKKLEKSGGKKKWG